MGFSFNDGVITNDCDSDEYDGLFEEVDESFWVQPEKKDPEPVTEEILECCEAQEKYCVSKHYPLFMPHKGICFCCGENIFSNGYTLEKASSELITGCPHCHQTFCD